MASRPSGGAFSSARRDENGGIQAGFLIILSLRTAVFSAILKVDAPAGFEPLDEKEENYV